MWRGQYFDFAQDKPYLRRLPKYRRICYFHYQWRASVISRAKKTKSGAKRAFIFPPLEDANAVQVGLMQVMRLLISGDMDSKTVGGHRGRRRSTA